MSLNIQRAADVGVIFPTGELRHEQTDHLARGIHALLKEDVQAVAVSFRDVTALLSEGIRALVMLRDRVFAAERTFYLTDLPPDVRYTLKITNLLEFLNHVPALGEVLGKHGTDESALAPFEPKKPPTEAADQVADETAPAKQKPEKQKKERAKPRRFQVFGGKREASDGGKAAPSGAAPAKAEPPAAPAGGGTGEKDADRELSQDELKKLVNHHIPGRLALEVIDLFVRSHETVIEADAVAGKLGVKPRAAKKILKELAARGVLKEVGGGAFNYAPEPELNRSLQEFVRLWHNPQRQPQLMAMLLAVER